MEDTNNTNEGQLTSKKERNLKWIQRFCLMDDMFLSTVFQKSECTELLLHLILNRDDLTVEEVRTQRGLKNLWGREARLDILAVDKDGKYYNIEVQRRDEGASPKRARYYSALLDTNITEPGENFENLAETYVIFITENDVLGADEPLYHIDRIIRETKADFKDDAHIIYVNSKIQDETALGKLMHDMYCTDPDDMNYKILADEVRYYKEDTKGVSKVSEIMQEMLAEERMEGRMEGEIKQAQGTVAYLQKKGLPVEFIAAAVNQNVSTVEGWMRESGAASGKWSEIHVKNRGRNLC